MNGYRATVLEMYKIPGGLCTAWKRTGYTFDISMHMLVGSRPGGPFHTMWRELGAVQGREFVYHRDAVRVESGGKHLEICTDPGRLERQMLELSPGDARRIREFVKLACGRPLLGAASLDAAELTGPLDGLRMLWSILPFVPTLLRYGRKTVQEYAGEFRDPFLRQAVRFLVDSPGWPMHRYPAAALSGFLPGAVSGSGVPIGGSQQVAFAIAARFKALGGTLRCNAKVTEILLEGDRAVGVRLADGSEVRADDVVWAADGHTAIFELLGGRYVDDGIRRMYGEWTPVRPLVHVALGVARDMTAEPAHLIFELPQPIVVAGEERKWLFVLHHSYDPTAAPPGKAAVEVWYPTEYAFWEKLAADRPRYEAEKKRIADVTLAELDRRWPGLAAQVEVVDVPTPATYVRYTGNWRASPDGWYITTENMRATPRRTLPGLDRFSMAGQWTAPYTGTVIAALSGRQVIQVLCRRDGRRFATTEAS
jgi:phytoene dehydrogenase-like protein